MKTETERETERPLKWIAATEKDNLLSEARQLPPLRPLQILGLSLAILRLLLLPAECKIWS